MSKTFLYADPHFGHEGVCHFLRADGTKLRPFANAHEMNKELVYRYLTTVKKEDKVYFLGDVAMKPQALEVLHNLPGDKVLIKGNHDQAKLSVYTRYFRDVRSCWQLGGCLLTHIPIHPSSLSRWKANIHGHLHANRVMRATAFSDTIDEKYLCVSVEHTDYAPIELGAALDRVMAQLLL